MGGIQARGAAVCLRRREIDAGPWLRRQGRIPAHWVRKWRSSVWDYNSAVVQDSVWNCSLQEHFVLAGGELWSFNKKHFFSLHPLTSTSGENYRAPKGAGGNPLRMWLLELQKELCFSATNALYYYTLYILHYIHCIIVHSLYIIHYIYYIIIR